MVRDLAGKTALATGAIHRLGVHMALRLALSQAQWITAGHNAASGIKP
jgi:NAD(P)-dependent dehydrogenase (short-subunit alcohol dehydrogenase family)